MITFFLTFLSTKIAPGSQNLSKCLRIRFSLKLAFMSNSTLQTHLQEDVVSSWKKVSQKRWNSFSGGVYLLAMCNNMKSVTSQYK